MFSVAMFTNILSDKIIQCKAMSRVTCRKLFNTIGKMIIHIFGDLKNLLHKILLGLLGPMCAVIGLYFVDCSKPYLAIFFIIAGLGLK